jgi:hypothetical protein
VQEFLRELLRDESIKVERAAGSTWTVNCSTERNVMTTVVWGTEEMPAIQIVRALLNQKPIRITPSFPEKATTAEKRAEAMTATTIANKHADRINNEFRTWLWRENERTDTLADLYDGGPSPHHWQLLPAQDPTAARASSGTSSPSTAKQADCDHRASSVRSRFRLHVARAAAGGRPRRRPPEEAQRVVEDVHHGTDGFRYQGRKRGWIKAGYLRQSVCMVTS